MLSVIAMSWAWTSVTRIHGWGAGGAPGPAYSLVALQTVTGVPGIVAAWNAATALLPDSSSFVSGRCGCHENANTQQRSSSTGTHAWPPSGPSPTKPGMVVNHGRNQWPTFQ